MEAAGDPREDTDVEVVRMLRTDLHLAQRELMWVRTEQEHQAESLARVQRQRTKLREQVDVLTEALAETLSQSYWAEQDHGLLRRRRSGEADLVREVEASPFFEGSWYVRKHPVVARKRISPALHYVLRGNDKGIDPGPRFSTTAYLAAHPEVRASGVPALVDAERRGRTDDADPGKLEAPSATSSDVHL